LLHSNSVACAHRKQTYALSLKLSPNPHLAPWSPARAAHLT